MAYPMAKEGSIDCLLGQLSIVAGQYSGRLNNTCKQFAEETTESMGHTRGQRDHVLFSNECYKTNLRLVITALSYQDE